MIDGIVLFLYVIWRAVLVVLAFCGWLIGKLIGTFAAGVWSGIVGSFKG